LTLAEMLSMLFCDLSPEINMLRKPSCPWCSSTVRRCCFCPRLAEILALREWAVHRKNTDELAPLDAELAAMGFTLPANDNEPRS
jgi:hypothetical protein